MQFESQVQQIHSLVPVKDVQNEYSIQKKHWQVIATAELMIPQLTFSLKITQVLLMFEMKIYLSIQIVVIPMVGPSQLKLTYSEEPKIEGYIPISSYQKHMAIGSAIFELPGCPRCLIGFSCKTHKHE